MKFHGILALILSASAGWAPAQTPFPNRVVRIVVPSTSGGGGDTIARIMAQHLTERWGKQVVVENRTGASNMIGGEFVAKSPPDGHVLLNGLSTLAINPSTHKKVLYDALRDFAPIVHAVSIANIVLVHPSLPAKTPLELAAIARTRPGQLLYGSGGHGTNNHLVMELFVKMPEVRERLSADGATVVAANGEQFVAFIKSETVKWAKVVKAAGIVAE